MIWGIQKCRHECSLGVNLVSDILCSFMYFTSVYNLKAIGSLLMEILHDDDLADIWEGCLAANEVVLSKRTLVGIDPHVKFERYPLNISRVRA